MYPSAVNQGVKLGSNWVQPGINLGSTEAKVDLQCPTVQLGHVPPRRLQIVVVVRYQVRNPPAELRVLVRPLLLAVVICLSLGTSRLRFWGSVLGFSLRVQLSGGRRCFPRQTMPFDSRHKGSKCVSTTWRAMGLAETASHVVGCHLRLNIHVEDVAGGAMQILGSSPHRMRENDVAVCNCLARPCTGPGKTRKRTAIAQSDRTTSR
jgi:hypothetical protein